MRYLPEPVDPQQVQKKDNVQDMGLGKWKQNNVDKEGSSPAHPSRPSARAGRPGGAAPREEKKGVFPIYTIRLLTSLLWLTKKWPAPI